MKFLFVIFLLPLQLFAQDITGVWAGTLYNDTTKQFIKYELAISEYDGKLSGYSHTIFIINGFENTGLKSIKVKKAGEEFLLEDDKLIYNNYTESPAKRVKTYSELALSKNDTAMVLSGPWNTNQTRVYTRLTGNIFLQKKKKIKETLIMAELENLGLTASLSFLISPTEPGVPEMVSMPPLNSIESKRPVDVAKDVDSNTITAKNTEMQKPGEQDAAYMRVSESGLNKNGRGKQVIKAVPSLPAATAEKSNTPGIVSAKPTQQTGQQQEAGKKIPGTVLHKEDSAANAGIIKEVFLPIAVVTQKNNTPGIVSPKPTQQTGQQQEAGKKIPGTVLHKEDSAANISVIKEAPSLVAATTPKNRPPGMVTAKTVTQQTGKRQGSGKKIPAALSAKQDSAANKSTISEAPSLIAAPTPKNKPANIVSLKPVIQLTVKQQEAGKEIPVKVLNKEAITANKNLTKREVPSLMAQTAIPGNEPANIVLTKPAIQQNGGQQKAGQEISAMVLQKNNDSGEAGITMVSKAAAEIATRKIETIRSVEIKSDSLLLTLYDNGEIDGDTVSVLLNGKVIMPREGLSLKAITRTLYLTPEMGDSIVLIMYAENLGSIPPNTGLLVVHDGEDVYEIRFTGDLKKNSSIILKRKRKK